MQTEPSSDVQAASERVYLSEYTYEDVFASLPPYERVWRAMVVSVKWGAAGFAYSLACAALMDGKVFLPAKQGSSMQPLQEVLIFIFGMMPISWACGYALPYMKNWWGHT